MKSIAKLALGGVIAAGLVAGPALAGDETKAAKLAPYKVVDDIAIPEPLAGKKGDPIRGKKLFVARKKGNCLACHKVEQLKEHLFHGEIGPELSDVASNMSPAEMRLRLVDPKIVNPETIMPAFYRVDGLHRVKKSLKGKPILTAQEIEDIIAFLQTLKMPRQAKK